jgi:hypothetical protein
MQYNKKLNNSKQAKLPIYSGAHIVGRVSGGTFYKTIHGSKHILRKPQAIAVSIDALEAAESAGAVKIQVRDVETDTTYRATIEHFRQAGIKINRGGFGEQIALTLDGWIKQREGEAIQAPLFGEVFA